LTCPFGCAPLWGDACNAEHRIAASLEKGDSGQKARGKDSGRNGPVGPASPAPEAAKPFGRTPRGSANRRLRQALLPRRLRRPGPGRGRAPAFKRRQAGACRQPVSGAELLALAAAKSAVCDENWSKDESTKCRRYMQMNWNMLNKFGSGVLRGHAEPVAGVVGRIPAGGAARWPQRRTPTAPSPWDALLAVALLAVALLAHWGPAPACCARSGGMRCSAQRIGDARSDLRT
jgi:hypothetical protein